jgi:hypothetical protein
VSGDREAVMRKIRACLRLSKSSNANEAATALRQAQALMAAHDLSERDIELSELETSDARTRSRGGEVPVGVWLLAVWVGRAFTCSAMQAYDFESRANVSTVIRFVGRAGRAEVAAYSFEVLRRQLERDIATHLRRVRKRANKIARREGFSVAWVQAIRMKLGLEDLPEAESQAHRAFMDRAGARTTKVTVSGGTERDRLAGFVAGSTAQLNPGVAGASTRALEYSPC